MISCSWCKVVCDGPADRFLNGWSCDEHGHELCRVCTDERAAAIAAVWKRRNDSAAKNGGGS